ncbi:MAG: aminopeptidase P family N-terminal domain-containing protein, partial [Burkholderiales bacterium]
MLSTPIERIAQLRQMMQLQRLHAYLIPSHDEFLGEYIPECAKRLEWLTGFSGSNGLAIIFEKEAFFFTDGRYLLQANNELPKQLFIIKNQADMHVWQWLAGFVAPNMRIGYDPKLFTDPFIAKYEEALTSKHCRFIPIETNLIDQIWQDKPAAPQGEIFIQPVEYAGRTWQEKLAELVANITQKGVDCVLLTAPESICWLLNIRANDVPYTPFLLAIALVTRDAKIILFTTERTIPDIFGHIYQDKLSFYSFEKFSSLVKSLKIKKIQLDSTLTPSWYIDQLEQLHCQFIDAKDPCILPKAVKHPIEIENMRKAHIKDGVALVQSLHWIDRMLVTGQSFTEIDIEHKLLEFRTKQANFYYPSFASIVGFNGHGAIVHYHA